MAVLSARAAGNYRAYHLLTRRQIGCFCRFDGSAKRFFKEVTKFELTGGMWGATILRQLECSWSIRSGPSLDPEHLKDQLEGAEDTRKLYPRAEAWASTPII